jgi:hypothetical protein
LTVFGKLFARFPWPGGELGALLYLLWMPFDSQTAVYG